MEHAVTSIPRIDLIATFLAGALVPVVVAWLWLRRGSLELKRPGQLSLHRRLLFINATSLLLGLLILAAAEWSKGSPWEETLRDVGRAFLAAAIIAYIVELAEIRDFFKTLVTELVTGMDFLRTLSSEDLLRHGQLSITEMVGRSVGDREYARSLIQPIFDATLPHLESVFRESFNAVLKLHVISTKEELAAILKDTWDREIDVEELSGPVYMIEMRYSYWLLRPSEQRKPFKGSVWVETKVIGGLALDLHARCTVEIDQVPQDLSLTSNQKGLLHQFSAEYEVPLSDPRVAVEVRTWQFDASRGSFSMQMIWLTKGLTVTFSSKHDIYPKIDVFGLHGEKSNVRSDDPNIATFAKADFILLPGHGFSISWSPESETSMPRARVSAPHAAPGGLAAPAQPVVHLPAPVADPATGGGTGP